MWTEYRRAYRDCADWLARYAPPWRWYLGTYDACRELRRAVAAATMAPGIVRAPWPVPRPEREEGTMPASKTPAATAMVDRFRYSPGDGHVYVWPDGQGTEIHVHRITSRDPWETRDTGDRIDITGVAQTAESMRAAVVLWKARRAAA